MLPYTETIKSLTEELLYEAMLQPTLNKDLWDGEKLNKKVRATLINIANDFLQGLRKTPTKPEHWGVQSKGIIIQPEDIIIAGSMANFNYTKSSDIDLHIVVNFSKVDKKLPVVQELFKDLVMMWNEKHKITIYKHPVELYVQSKYRIPDESPLVSNGLYSVMYNKWLNKPTRKVNDVDPSYIRKKAQPLIHSITSICKSHDKVSLKRIQNLRDKLHNMRTRALQKGGEFAPENLVYKFLRKEGYLQKLIETEQKIYDRIMSLK